MVIRDKKSFLAGIQVGRRLKAWDAAREREQEQTRTVEVVEIPEEEEGDQDGRA